VIKKKIKILLIGPVTNVAAGLIGGATISFGYLIGYLESAGEDYKLINTQKFPTGPGRILNPFYVILKVLLNIFRSDVIFLNSSRGGTKYLVPLLYVLAKIFNIKFVFRPFGGDINEYTSHYNKWQKWIFKNTVLKADIFFLQTKELMAYYANSGANIIPFSTSRQRPTKNVLRGDRPYNRRFIYLGFINEAKGIDHLLEAARQLGDAYTVHIYGPIKEEKYHTVFKDNPNVYQGVLTKEKVLSTLRLYDVLVLPTHYEGEGYPGAIIEAYSLGIPVISTRWKAIPEIVKDQETGLLIDPQSTRQLVKAMQYFNEENYKAYSKNAMDSFENNFDVNQVTERAVTEIKNLLKK